VKQTFTSEKIALMPLIYCQIPAGDGATEQVGARSALNPLALWRSINGVKSISTAHRTVTRCGVASGKITASTFLPFILVIAS
jgi:hypothetical protein